MVTLPEVQLGRRWRQSILVSTLVLLIFAFTVLPGYAKAVSGVMQGTWSPDGSQLAVSVGDTIASTWAIYVVNASDLAAVRLVADAYSPVWSPDGEQIAFSRPMTEGIYTIAADGSGPITELSDSGYTPVWSPDGTSLTYVDAGILYVTNPDGTDRQALTDNATPQVWGPRWSPDGQSIAFVSNQYQSDMASIYVVNADGSNLVELSDRASYEAASWSPDGEQIALVSECKGLMGVCVMNPDGSDPHKISSGWGMAWSPDGQQLAYVLYNSICTVEVSGSNQHCFTDPHLLNISELAWSPDGQQMFFLSMEQPDKASPESMYSMAYLMNSDGSNLRTLSDDQFSD